MRDNKPRADQGIQASNNAGQGPQSNFKAEQLLESDLQPVIARELPVVAAFGAGTIGRMLAYEALIAGHEVSIIDPSPAAIESAKQALQSRLVKDGFSSGQQVEMLGRLKMLAGLPQEKEVATLLTTVGVVIEAIPEQKALKAELFAELDRLCHPNVPICSASSSLPVREVNDQLAHPERFLNAHPLQQGIAAIEIMPSTLTATDITEFSKRFFSGIGMVPVMVQQENVGFIFNIAWRNIKKTALDLVDRGINTPEDFDRIWMMAFGSDVGPFGIMDRVGLDVVLAIEQRYAIRSGDPSDQPPSFLVKMVERGELGLKSGKGFYSYPGPAYQRSGFLEFGVEGERPASYPPTRASLIGSWELVSYAAKDAKGNILQYPMGSDATGLLLYLPNGTMAVSLTKETREHFAGADPLVATQEEQAKAYREFFTYYGKFRYSQGVIYHDVERCSFPNWIGTTLVRFASINDSTGELKLSTAPVAVNDQVAVQELIWRKRR